MLRDILICLGSVFLAALFVLVYFWVSTDLQILSFSSILGFAGKKILYLGKDDVTLLIGSITGFYGTIITLLIALLALTSSLAFIVVRASASEASERAAAVQVPLFLQTKEGKELVQRAAEARVEGRIQRVEDAFQTLINRLEDEDFNLTDVANVLRGAVDEATN